MDKSSREPVPAPELTEAEQFKKARELAQWRLSVREYSASELRSYLRRKGIAGEIADAVVEENTVQGTLDDARYARVITRHQAFRDKGPRHILAKLKSKGVRVGLKEVEALFTETSPRSELDAVRHVLERRYPDALEDRKSEQRAIQGLLRRGFSSDAVRKCLAELKAAKKAISEQRPSYDDVLPIEDSDY